MDLLCGWRVTVGKNDNQTIIWLGTGLSENVFEVNSTAAANKDMATASHGYQVPSLQHRARCVGTLYRELSDEISNYSRQRLSAPSDRRRGWARRGYELSSESSL